MNIIKRYSTGKFIKRIYNNMFIIVLVVMLVFTSSVLYITKQTILEKELRYNNVILNNINELITNKLELADSVLINIYDDYYSNNNFISFIENSFNSENYEYFEQKRNFDNYSMSIFGADNSITDITVFKADNNSSYYYSRDSQSKATKHKYDVNKIGKRYLLPAEFRFYDDKRTYTVCMPLTSILTGKHIGAIFLEFDTEYLEKYIEKYNLLGDVFILTNSYDILYDSTGNYDIDVVKTHMKQNKNDIVKSSELHLVAEINEKILFEKYFFIQLLVLVLGIICSLISLLLLLRLLKKFSFKIDNVSSAISKIKSGNLDTRLPITEDYDEIDEISVAVNDMLTQLNNYINKYYVSEIYKNRAMLSALEAQINPHFLNNTLEAIRMKAVVDGNSQVAEMIYILSRLFHNSIKGKSTITVEKEISCSELYLKLHQIRYPGKLTTIFDIKDDVKDLTIPKNILQPVIENYIMHGFRKDRDDNVLKIRIKSEIEYVVILVTDNGLGIDREHLADIRSKIEDGEIQKNNIGLANIRGRLKCMYDESFLSIKSSYGKGTTVMIKFQKKYIDSF